MNCIGEKSIGFEDQREGTETNETRLTNEDVPEGPQEHPEYVETEAEEHLEQFEGDNIDDLNDAIRVLWRRTISRLILRKSHMTRASKHVPEPTLKDSKSSRTRIDTRSMSPWVGESPNRKTWERSFSTAVSRGPTPI